jgi:hypothetical protein
MTGLGGRHQMAMKPAIPRRGTPVRRTVIVVNGRRVTRRASAPSGAAEGDAAMTATARLGATPTLREALDLIAALTERVSALESARDAIAEPIEAAVRQMRAERDAAVEALTLLLADTRADVAAHAARLDRIDPRGWLPGFVTLKQAAGACGYTCEAVRQWAATGQVTASKTGGRVSVELSSVLARAERRG